MTINYTQCLTFSSALKESSDCAVCAVAIAGQVPYLEVHKAFKEAGRQKGRGVSLPTVFQVVDQLNLQMEDITETVKAKTICTIPQAVDSGSYMVVVKGHIAAVRGNRVEDWTNGRRHKVRKVFRVTGKNAPATTEEAPAPAAKPRAKAPQLTDDQVRAIRQDTRPHKEIAEEHGINTRLVSRIKRGRRFAEVV